MSSSSKGSPESFKQGHVSIEDKPRGGFGCYWMAHALLTLVALQKASTCSGIWQGKVDQSADAKATGRDCIWQTSDAAGLGAL